MFPRFSVYADLAIGVFLYYSGYWGQQQDWSNQTKENNGCFRGCLKSGLLSYGHLGVSALFGSVSRGKLTQLSGRTETPPTL
jgi:hypothetical protein